MYARQRQIWLVVAILTAFVSLVTVSQAHAYAHFNQPTADCATCQCVKSSAVGLSSTLAPNVVLAVCPDDVVTVADAPTLVSVAPVGARAPPSSSI